jgi:hypothetical protein
MTRDTAIRLANALSSAYRQLEAVTPTLPKTAWDVETHDLVQAVMESAGPEERRDLIRTLIEIRRKVESASRMSPQ